MQSFRRSVRDRAGRDFFGRCEVQSGMDESAREEARPEGGAVPRYRLPGMVRWGLILALCGGLYALAGFFLVPWLIRTQFPEAIGAYTGGTASVEDVRFNPFALSLEMQGFVLREPSGPTALSFGDLQVDVGFWESLKGELHLDRIRLADPFVRAAIDRQGRLNLYDLFGGRRADRGGDGGLPPVGIDRFEVERGRLEFLDQSRAAPFRETVFPVSLELSDFTMQAEGAPASFRLAAHTDANVSLHLDGNLSANPLRSEGGLRLENLKVRTLWEYARDRLDFAVAGGTLDFSGRYLVEVDPLRVAVHEGKLDVSRLQLAGPVADRVLASFPSTRVRGISADSLERSFAIDSVSSRDGQLTTWLTPEGRINLASWFPEAVFGQGSSDPPGPEDRRQENWSVRIGDITLDQYAVSFEDRSVSAPVVLEFAPIHLALKHFSTEGSQPVQVSLKSGVNGSGRFGLDGNFRPGSQSAELAVELSRLPLPQFQPYVNRFARLDLVKGFLNLQGKLAVQMQRGDENPPVLSYRGDAAIGELEARLPGGDQPLVSWETLAFSGLDFQSEPVRLRIDDVAANRLYARVVVRPDRTLNLAQVFIQPKPEESRREAGGKPPMTIMVDMIRLENSRADFTDQSIRPNFSTGIHNLHGTIRGLNSKPGQSAELLLEGRVDPYAPVRIEGKMNLFSPTQFADIHMRFTNVDMTTLSPYSGKFAGYRIRMGKMSLDLDYQLKDQRLDSTNRIVLTRLVLGEPVTGSKAPDLPLHLAIALLKDSRGRIELNLPIRGDLSDPEVSLPGLVGKVLRGLIRKVVASPFSLLARLVGGKGEELRYVGFSPGEAVLGNEQVEQLSKLAKGLRERPALYLKVTGVAGPERDRQALAEKNLITRLKIAKLMEEDRPIDPESIRNAVLSRSNYERYLAKLYRQETGKEGAVSVEAMKQALLEPKSVTRTRLRLLAQERTTAIRDYLVRSEAIKPERIFVTDVQVEKGSGSLVRSELGLRAS